MLLYQITQNIRKCFPDLYIFNINSNNFKIIFNQYLENDILNKFINLSSTTTEPPIDFDANIWNKLSTLKRNGTLRDKYKDSIKSAIVNMDIFPDNLNENKIKEWALSNYLNPTVILKYLYMYENMLFNKNLSENLDTIVWATQFRSSFSKHLTQNNINEKIIRSFLYGRPMNYTFTTRSNVPMSIMNFENINVSFAKPQFGDVTVTVAEVSNDFTFYLKYKEEIDKSGLTIFNCFILSRIEPVWLMSADPLIVNPLIQPDIIVMEGLYDGTIINTVISNTLQRYKKDLINSWNQNFSLWDSNETPILRHFYKLFNKIISKHMAKY